MTNRLLLLALATAASAVAQSVINFAQLPACAKTSCTVLTQADANCVPPAAPVTNQGIYQSCVCQSALLTGLKASGSICQTAGCSPQDATAISQYYISLCAGPVVQPTTTAATTTTTTTAGAKNTAAAGAAGGNAQLVNSAPPSWISTHWKYVLMVVIIAVAMAVFWIGGIYVRRHFDRKRDAKRANMAGYHSTPGFPGAPGAPGPAPAMASLTGTVAVPANGQGRTTTPLQTGILPRPRSRANTLQRERGPLGSKSSLSQPVVWGPHQHQAFSNANSNSRSNTPVPVLPPSSSVYRNPDAMRSEPNRFLPPRAMSPGEQTRHATTAHGAPAGTAWGSSPNTPSAERPLTRDVNRRTPGAAMRSESSLGAHAEGQSAEICEAPGK